jgi:hypothetical protein
MQEADSDYEDEWLITNTQKASLQRENTEAMRKLEVSKERYNNIRWIDKARVPTSGYHARQRK